MMHVSQCFFCEDLLMSQQPLSSNGTSNDRSVLGCGCLAFVEFFALFLLLVAVVFRIPYMTFLSLVAALGAGAATMWVLVHRHRIGVVRAQVQAQQQYETWLAQQKNAAQLAEEQHKAAVEQLQRKAYEAEQQARVQREKEEELQAQVATLEALLALDATSFEEAIGHLLEFLSCTDVLILDGQDGERNIDILCRDEAGKKTAVRCRQYGPNTEVEYAEVVQFVDAATAQGQGVERLIFLTTSTYTNAAVEAAATFDVTLMDAVGLADAMRQFRASVEK
jgi:restriction system protein